MTDKPTEPSLADLCAPLSAKVMPKRALAGRSSRAGTEGQLLLAQRNMQLSVRLRVNGSNKSTTKGSTHGEKR